MRTHTKETQANLTPDMVLEILKRGNQRFVNNIKAHRNLLKQVNETSTEQFPFAVILSCIDSRTSAELIFDLGLGDIFSIRIAGNILNDDILGSMEFACKLSGSKLVVVLGHTNCGAVIGACDNIKLGHLTSLVDKIKPSIEMENQTVTERNGKNDIFVENVTLNNVNLTVDGIRKRSEILSALEKDKKIKIIGGIYDVETGIVKYL